jgi:hypothetical protein
MTSPEERREARIDATRTSAIKLHAGDNSGRLAARAFDNALLAYFDENEPAVAAAIRYGLVPEMECKELSKQGHSLCINYPEGHPKR